MGAEESKASQGRAPVGPPNGGNSAYLLDAVLEHCGSIHCMALSEDSSILATGSDDRSVRLWTTKSARCHCFGILSGHEDRITYITIDGVSCVSCSVDRTIRKWDMATCECLMVFEGHKNRVNRVICAGDFIFSSSSDCTVCCWDLDDGKCLRTFSGHHAGVFPLQYLAAEDTSLDGDHADDQISRPVATPKIRDMIVTGSTDCTARTWMFETGRTVSVFRGHTGPVTCLSTDADLKVLITTSTDGSVRSWVLSNGEQLRVFDGHRMPILCMMVVGDRVYSGSADCLARSFDISGRSRPTVFECHEKAVNCIKLVDNLVFTGGADSIATCFDAHNGEIKRVFRCPTNTQINCIQIVDTRLFVGASDNVLRIFSLRGLRSFKPSLKPWATKMAVTGILARQPHNKLNEQVTASPSKVPQSTNSPKL